MQGKAPVVLRALFSTLFAVWLGACSTLPPQAPTVGLHAAHDAQGAAVRQHLATRFSETTSHCRGLPSPLCSGILLRTTTRGNGYDVWDPNPGNPQPNGISFSWLRIDSYLTSTAWGIDNGYILLPYFYADSPGDRYEQLELRCAFGIDGDTNARQSADRDGCGPVPGVAKSGPCQSEGITTAAKWIAQFGNASNRYRENCGFTIKAGTPDSGYAFTESNLIRARLPSSVISGLHNEIVVKAWAKGVNIPLEAFFYLKGTLGVTAAKANQSDFNTRLHRWVPVIQITMPPVAGGTASFGYSANDQAIP